MFLTKQYLNVILLSERADTSSLLHFHVEYYFIFFVYAWSMSPVTSDALKTDKSLENLFQPQSKFLKNSLNYKDHNDYFICLSLPDLSQ